MTTKSNSILSTAALSVALLSLACSGSSVPADPDAADQTPDASGIDGAACTWTDSMYVDPCTLSPAGDLSMTDVGIYVLDTDAVTLTFNGTPIPIAGDSLIANNENVLLVVTDALQLAPLSELRILGTRAVVFASFGSVTIGGVVNASSTDGELGGGGSRVSCLLSTGGAGEEVDNTGGGGGGGGYGTAGGVGGRGNADGNQTSAAAAGLAGGANRLIAGGCAGGDGGRNGGGVGGAGGGSVHFASALDITVSGTIAANGEGGKAGNQTRDGAGGGGAGGYLGFEAPTITIESTAIIAANGGGGGSTGGSQQDGEDGRLDGAPAAGGNGFVDGGDGGTGTAAPEDGQNGNSGFGTNNGGGGGGGAVGRITVNGTLQNDSAMVSPEPVQF